ncbi:hypothetical protein FH972_026144 [Carpinus fangiana]|uniref:Apple domain-containing protein n=1 Tax=Carpinus fangiana TaxID=176857 RepID=A0A5N6L3L4_9ROSI|nr:hypothetical protein FH972_026144 [Carpinus fangiana]
MRADSFAVLGASFAIVASASSVNSAASSTTTTTPSATPASGTCASQCSLVPGLRYSPKYHCASLGSIRDVTLLEGFASTSGDYTSCYFGCAKNPKCVSFSYSTLTGACELYDKTIAGKGFTSDPALSKQSFWNFRGCFTSPNIVCTDPTPSTTPTSSTPSATPTPSTPALTCAGAIELPATADAPFLVQWAINSQNQPVYLAISLGTVQGGGTPTFAVGSTYKATEASTGYTFNFDATTSRLTNNLMNADFTTSVFTPATDASRVSLQSQRYYQRLDETTVLRWSRDTATGLLTLSGTNSLAYLPIYCEGQAPTIPEIQVRKTGTAMPDGCVAACPAAVKPAPATVFIARRQLATKI